MFILAKINKYSGFFTGTYREFAHGSSLMIALREPGNKLFMDGKGFFGENIAR
jgi:hypothetical protein